MTNGVYLFFSAVYVALSSEIGFGFADLHCISLCFLCLLSDVRLLLLINITPVPCVDYCDGLDCCILSCILFVFMLALLCFCVATEFSVNKDSYILHTYIHT